MGKAFLALQGARDFTLQVHVQDQPRFLFNSPINKVVRLDRDELNRWLMDQTGSVSYVPYIGAILLMPYEWDILTKFDQVATGLVPSDIVGVADQDAGHIQMAEYAPEVVYLARIDRASLVSGWDVPGSLANVQALNRRLHSNAEENAPIPKGALQEPVPGHSHEAGEPPEDDSKFSSSVSFVVDSTTEVLLERMQRVARLIGLVSLLVALPLLWMAWVLAGSLAGLLMLNERRSLPAGVLTEPRQLAMFAAFLVISVVLALIVSRRLVKYAMTISPLEASRRVSGSEAIQASTTFGPLQQLSLALGGYVLFGGT